MLSRAKTGVEGLFLSVMMRGHSNDQLCFVVRMALYGFSLNE